MARTGGKRHLDETDAGKQNATANDVMREERFRRGRESAREDDLIIRDRLSQPWHSCKPLQPRCPVIRATSVARAIAIQRSTRRSTFLRLKCARSLVLEHPVSDDAAPSK